MKSLGTKLTRLTLALAACATLATPALTQAQPSAHYVPGVEGIKAATLPPPGFYVRDYNVVYFSDRLNDANGDRGPFEPEAFIYANIPRVIWITEYKLLGGYIGFDALIPLQYTDLEVKSPLGTVFDDSTFGVGDLFAEVTWSAHSDRFDFSLAYGIWAPTGNSDTGLNTEAGLGYWTHMLTAGITYYIDHDRKWAVSALNRYEINTEKDDTDITPGQAWTIESALSYSIWPTIDVGLVGYYQQQITEDDGSGAWTEEDRVAAIGGEVSAFCTKLGFNTSLRYLYEFLSEDRLQGHTIALTLTKRF